MELRENIREPIGTISKNLFKENPKHKIVSSVTYEEHPQPKIEPPEIPIENPFTIRFNAGDNGNLSGNKEVHKHLGEPIFENEIPEVEPKAGYEFTGWDKNPNDYRVTENTEFIAQYRHVPPIIPPNNAIPWYKRF